MPQESKRYGLGFWLAESSDVAILVGMDTGVSFASAHDPRRNVTYAVVSNTSDGAWPLETELERRLL